LIAIPLLVVITAADLKLVLLGDSREAREQWAVYASDRLSLFPVHSFINIDILIAILLSSDEFV